MAKFRALLIDDEEELVSTLVERLGYRDIEAEYALEGNDALQKLTRMQYNVVVLDLKLPGMDGLEVLRRINNQYPEIPVLLITGHGSSSEEIDKRPQGAFAYLAKPINLDTLIDHMQEAIDHRRNSSYGRKK
jgi:DNA-binding NtrC family response regulator